MRRVMLVAVLLLVLVVPAAAQGDETAALVDRIEDLEARVTELEARLETPPPPPMTHEVDGFLFQRVSYRQSSSNYISVVGEIAGPADYLAVTARVTLYGENGEILATDTLIVENVTTEPRPFDTLLRDADAAEVHSLRFTIERTR